MREKENKIRVIKPGMIKQTTRTMPSGKQVLVMRRDKTITGISWRIPVC